MTSIDICLKVLIVQYLTKKKTHSRNRIVLQNLRTARSIPDGAHAYVYFSHVTIEFLLRWNLQKNRMFCQNIYAEKQPAYVGYWDNM